MEKNNYAFSFIIGYKHDASRFPQLRRILDYYSNFSGIQIILLEADSHSKIDHLNLGKGVKHIFVKTEEKFYNRGWALNTAFKATQSNVIVVSDTDLILEPKLFIDGLKALEEYDFVSPYNKVVDLTPSESILPYDGIFKLDREGRVGINIAGGMFMIKRSAYEQVAFFDENIKDWGIDDNLVEIKTKAHLKWIELEGNIHHLYHTKASVNPEQYQKNLQYLNRVANMNADELVRYINNTSQNIGKRNKYS